MEMSFQQYIDNPLGKRNAVFSQRDLFKNLYTEKFDKLMDALDEIEDVQAVYHNADI